MEGDVKKLAPIAKLEPILVDGKSETLGQIELLIGYMFPLPTPEYGSGQGKRPILRTFLASLLIWYNDIRVDIGTPSVILDRIHACCEQPGVNWGRSKLAKFYTFIKNDFERQQLINMAGKNPEVEALTKEVASQGKEIEDLKKIINHLATLVLQGNEKLDRVNEKLDKQKSPERKSSPERLNQSSSTTTSFWSQACPQGNHQRTKL